MRRFGPWSALRPGGFRGDRLTSVPILLLFAVLPMAAVTVPLLRLPASELAALGVVAITLWRRPSAVMLPSWLAAALGSLVVVLAASGLLQGSLGLRRIGHVGLYGLLVFVIGTGRVPMTSAARGLFAGLAVSVLADTTPWSQGNYPDRLTGLFGDPNVAAFYVVVLGFVASSFLISRSARLVLFALIVVVVAESLSRTGLIALVLATVWLLVAGRVRRGLGVTATAMLAWWITVVAESFRLWGAFAGREGSDLLRQRISLREREIVSLHPWIGSGPGAARVVLEEGTFFFHNSYLAARAEGGWLLLAALVITIIGVLLWSGPAIRRDAVAAEAAVVAVLACAFTLGEVLLELPAAVAVGAVALHRLRPRSAANVMPAAGLRLEAPTSRPVDAGRGL